MACLLLINCTFAAFLNISGLYAVKLLGAPSAQIAAKLNVPIVALLSCTIMGETLTLIQAASALLLLFAVWMFEYAQKHEINDVNTLLSPLNPGQKPWKF